MPETIVVSNLGKNIQVKAGEVYEFSHNTSTRAGHVHPKGSLVVVLRHTDEAPYGEIGENGNWVCQTQFGISVWSTLEQGIARGLYKKVEISDMPKITVEPPLPTFWEALRD